MKKNKKRTGVARMAGLYREGQSFPWTGEFRVGGRVCQPGS